LIQGFLRCFRDPIRVPRIRANYHRVPRIRGNRVPTGPYRVPNTFLKKPDVDCFCVCFFITTLQSRPFRKSFWTQLIL